MKFLFVEGFLILVFESVNPLSLRASRMQTSGSITRVCFLLTCTFESFHDCHLVSISACAWVIKSTWRPTPLEYPEVPSWVSSKDAPNTNIYPWTCCESSCFYLYFTFRLSTLHPQRPWSTFSSSPMMYYCPVVRSTSASRHQNWTVNHHPKQPTSGSTHTRPWPSNPSATKLKPPQHSSLKPGSHGKFPSDCLRPSNHPHPYPEVYTDIPDLGASLPPPAKGL